MSISLKRLTSLVTWSYRQFIADRCLLRSASLTYITLLAIAPLLVLFINIISLFPQFIPLQDKIQNFIVNSFVPSAGNQVLWYLTVIEKQASILPWWTIAFLALTLFFLILSLESNVNDIWGLMPQRRLSRSLIVYWILALLGPLFLSIGTLLTGYLASIKWLGGWGLQLGNHAYFLSFALVWLGFLLLYYLVPHTRVKIKHAMMGALVAAVLFTLSKYLFQYYVLYFPTYKQLYGVLATIPLFLIWVYISWVIFFVGAQVVNGLRLSRAKRSTHQPDLLVVCFHIVLFLAANEHEPGLTLEQLLAKEKFCSVPLMTEALERLYHIGLIDLDKRKYHLSCDLALFSVYQFCYLLKCYIPREIDSEYGLKPVDQKLNECFHNWHQQGQASQKMSLQELSQFM